MDDEICVCGHSKGYHGESGLEKHGLKCEKCSCPIYTWKTFVKYQKI